MHAVSAISNIAMVSDASQHHNESSYSNILFSNQDKASAQGTQTTLSTQPLQAISPLPQKPRSALVVQKLSSSIGN